MNCNTLFQVQTNFEQVGERQFLSVIVDADNVNHVVIFMTGQIPFPEGSAGLSKSSRYCIFKLYILSLHPRVLAGLPP